MQILTKAPQKKLDNLEDGIYGRDINECYSSDSLSRGKCFLLVTLPNSRNLSKVMVWVQPKGANFDKLLNVEVRAGNSLPPLGNDFSSWALIGVMNGPFNYDQEVTVTANRVLSAKYVSLKELDPRGQIQIGLLEIS